MKKPSVTTDANWTAANSIQSESIRNARMTEALLLAKAKALRRMDMPPRNF
jgi:hypothetical protein